MGRASGFMVCLVGSLVLAGTAWAQAPVTRTLAGTVLRSDTHLPVAGAAVVSQGQAVITAADGRFTLTVPAGRATVEVTAPGYFHLATEVDLTTGNVTAAEFLLAPNTAFNAVVEVVATAPTVSPAATPVAPADVLKTPGVLDNVFRALQLLPGVAPAEEFSSRLTVRGGAPDQNLTVMDGVEIHDPYRLFGLTSAFNPEIIRRFELATGGFSAKYGDRLSSLLVVENRDGDASRRIGGSATLSVTDANVVLEGFLPRVRNGSWLVTGRRTYYDVVAARLTGQQFPGFADLQTKLAWEPRTGHRFTTFGLRSRQSAALDIDRDRASGAFSDDTANDLAWLRYDRSLGSSGHAATIGGYSNTASEFGVAAQFETRSQRSNAADDATGFSLATVNFTRRLTVRDWSLRQELAWGMGAHIVEAGAEFHHLETGLRFLIAGDRNPVAANGSSVQGGAGLPDRLDSSTRAMRGGAWVTSRWRAGARALMETGLRVDRASFTRETTLSPRVSATVSLGPSTSLVAGAGRYTQSPGYEKSVTGDYVLDVTAVPAGTLRSERAWLTSASLEHVTADGLSARVEGYYKRLDRILTGRLETEGERRARVGAYDFPAALQWSLPSAPVITTVPTNDGRGRAYGLDLLVSRMRAPVSSRWRGWASYTWGRAEREAYGRVFPFEYDRRHAVSSVISFRWTEQWELASTFRWASGFPRTAPTGVRVAGTADRNDIDGDGNRTELVPARDAQNGLVYTVDLGGIANLNGGRLPDFARADVRATWRPKGARGRWEFYAEVLNLLNRKNASALDPRLAYDPSSDRPRIVEQPDQGVPRLPTLGLRWRF